jgi:hypothetical protein
MIIFSGKWRLAALTHTVNHSFCPHCKFGRFKWAFKLRIPKCSRKCSTYLTFSLLCIIKEGICVSRPSDGSNRTTAQKWMLLALNTLSLYPANRYVPSHSTIIFKLCRRRFHIKIAFAMTVSMVQGQMFNPLTPELNPICYLLALLGAHHFLHVSRIRVKLLTFRLLMSYIYGAPILDVSRSHTTTQHSW